MRKPRTVAIVQARMGSSRLPGKVLLPLAGKPVLWHVVHRLRKCRLLDEVVVATSTSPSDDPLAAYCRTEGIPVFRGSEDNVLERYALAVRETDPDVIVRVTGDAALIDCGIVDALVERLLSEGADYCIPDQSVRTLHEGMDPFTRDAFERILSEGASSPVAREHVSAYMKENPERFRIAYLPAPMEHRVEGGRFSVDTPADLEFLEAVYRRLGAPAGEAEASAVAALLRDDPSLLSINRHVYQKKASEESRKVLVRCDGGAHVGMGHVVRCTALADEFRERLGWGVRFAVATGREAVEHLSRRGYPVDEKPEGAAEEEWITGLLAGYAPDALVLDVRTELPAAALSAWRGGATVAVVDDLSDRRLAADHVFYPPIPQVRRLSWEGFAGELHAGWEWVLLRRQFARVDEAPSRTVDRDLSPVLLVTMGGSDPAGLTLMAVDSLRRVESPFRCRIVVGPAFPFREELEERLSRASFPHEVLAGVEKMAEVMGGADLALASFGVTAYELAAAGVPAIHLCLTADHAESARPFSEARIAVPLGIAGDVSEESVALAVESLLQDDAIRREMREKALSLVDGKGALRVAQAIASGGSRR